MNALAPIISNPRATEHRSPPPDVCDVWSHWGTRYRTRAMFLLILNMILFAGVCNFAFWIRSGAAFAPMLDGYWDEFAQTFRFWGPDNRTLGATLLEPISVQDVPMQIPILGLLMAALISIPILVALLYRVWASLPFIALVGFLAVMPWLALTLVASCVIASVKPFRSRYPFMSALIGTLPAVAYLILASNGTRDVVVGRIEPIDRIKFFAPWVLAIVAATLVFAIVLIIARLVKYRPGTTTPLLAIMFGLPVILFEWHVGRDELHYRLLESLHDHHFQDVDAGIPLSERTYFEWKNHPLPRPSFGDFRRRREALWQYELGDDPWPFEYELVRSQLDVVARCDWFLKQFPGSRYAANALYLKAQTLDMRVTTADYRTSRWIRYYDDFPAAAARETWSTLAENFPDSPLTGVAELRLAQFEARACDSDRALAHVGAALQRLTRHLQAGGDVQTDPVRNPWLRRPAEASLGIPIDRRLLEAHRLMSLLTSNHDDRYGLAPLCGPRTGGAVSFGLLSLDPRHSSYERNLRILRAAYPNASVTDNLELELALLKESPSQRIDALEAHVLRFPDFDSTPEALYRLGQAYRSIGDAPRGDARLGRLVREFPDSIWAERARLRVRSTAGLGMTAEATSRGRP